MIQTARNTAAPAARGASGAGKRILIGALLAMVVLVPFTFLIVVQYGVVVGEEFSPDRFQRRSYHYFEIPLFHVQITPLERNDRTNDLELYLAKQKLIPAGAAKPRWDLATLSRGDMEGAPRDAEILCRYLDLTDDEGNLVWLAWTKEQPDLAKTFWPAVADVARQGAYFLAPDLFHLAEQVSEPTALQQQLARRLSRRYEELGRVQQRLGQHQRAADLFAAALQYDPDFAKARQGRKKSLQTLGKTASPPAPPAS